jgi:hypothetical protein
MTAIERLAVHDRATSVSERIRTTASAPLDPVQVPRAGKARALSMSGLARSFALAVDRAVPDRL